MNTLTIKHKIRVFISSKCGGKYTIARKALKELLLSTGLVDEPYVFECESGSSEDTVSSYLDYIDESNLCIFLIDNKDGVPGPVLSEERRAKEKGLRLIYVFCEENKKEPTVMQTEIKNRMTQKYVVVSSFSDIVKAAYDSAMQDIVTVYKKKSSDENLLELVESKNQTNISTTNFVSNKRNTIDTIKETSYEIGQCALFAKSYLGSLSKTENSLLKIVSLGQFYEKNESNDFDEELSCFLNAVFYKTEFDEESYKKLTDKIIRKQPKFLAKLLSLRYSSINYYFKGSLDKALRQLQLALNESIENENIPNWISLDVAIDIRNIVGIIDELNNKYTRDNEGQKFIDDNPEYLCYPEIDRLVSDYRSNLIKYYFKIHYSSPYSVNVGGLDSLFIPIAKVFCIAFSNASLVHIFMTRNYATEALFALSSLYNDHDFKVELIRESIIIRDKRKLDTITRAFDNGSEFINTTNVNKIMDNLNYILPVCHQMMSKYLVLTYLGYYFDDANYEKYSTELLEHAKCWIKDDKHVFIFGDYIFHFLRENHYRIDNDKIVELILSFYDHGLNIWYINCMKIMQDLDFSKVSIENQNRVLNMLIFIVSNQENRGAIPGIDSAIIRFAKKATVNIDTLKKVIKDNMFDFYENIFSLEFLPNASEEYEQFIEKYIDSAKHDNETQGVSGVCFDYSNKPLRTLKNIVSSLKTNLCDEIIEKMINLSLDTLKCSNQLVSAKSDAIELIITLYFMYPYNPCWNGISKILIEKRNEFLQGKEMELFDKRNNYNLCFAYELLLLIFDQGIEEEALEYLLTLDSDDNFSIIDALRLLCHLFINSEESVFSENFLSGCAHFAIMMSSTTERDTQFHSVKCLIEMTKYEKLQKIILQHLSRLMDSGTMAIKTTIASRVKKIKSKNLEYTDYILKKASVDNNFLVRMAAHMNL